MIIRMRELYPEIEPYHTFSLKVSELHTLYVEECGNPEGTPVVFLHGGPGGGCGKNYRRYFNPQKYRIVLFDQRGCGRSQPHSELEGNTTWDLVSDIEKIREHLEISKWAVFGGSWGSTLALAYAQTHPESCTKLFLRGIFMLRKKELDWFYQEGCSRIYPDFWEDYIKPIPENERHEMMKAFYKRLTSKDASVRREAATAWAVWEAKTSKLIPDQAHIQGFEEDIKFADAFARIECHYFMNNGWFEPEDQLLRNVYKIRHIPAVIVHGRYDVVCPVENAWELKKAWPEAELHIIPDSGHALAEVGIRSKLIEETEKFVSE